MVNASDAGSRKNVPCGGTAAKIDCRQELLPRLGPVTKGSKHAACNHRGFRLVYTSTGHASMGSLNDNGDASRLEHTIQGIGDLRRHSLLNLHASRVDLDDPGQFGDADNPLVGQVAEMRPPDDRRHVVLAVRYETDIAQQHHLVISGHFLESPLQQLVRIFVISGKPLSIGASDTRRCVDQPLAPRVIAGPTDQGDNGLFDFGGGRSVGGLDRFRMLLTSEITIIQSCQDVHSDSSSRLPLASARPQSIRWGSGKKVPAPCRRALEGTILRIGHLLCTPRASRLETAASRLEAAVGRGWLSYGG